LKKVVSLQPDLRINPLEGKEIMMNKELNFKEVPQWWAICLDKTCPLSGNCLRHQGRKVVADGSKAWTEWSSIWTKESRPWTQHEKACHSLHTDATKQLAGIQPFVA